MTNRETRQPQTSEQTRPIERSPKNTLADIALFIEFFSDQTTIKALKETIEFNKRNLLKQADQMQRVKEIMADLLLSTSDIDTAINEIDKSIEYYSVEQAKDDVANEDFDELDRQLKAHEQARQLIIQNKDTDFLNERKDFAEWKTKRRERHLNQQAQEVQVAQKQATEHVYSQIGIESPREREKSRERAVEIVLREGGVCVHMSAPQGISESARYSGFQKLTTRLGTPLSHRSSGESNIEHQLITGDDLRQKKSIRDIFTENNISEIIDIRPFTTIDEEVVRPAQKGFMGTSWGEKPAEKKYSKRPVLHNERVTDGKAEPAVLLTYYIPSGEWEDYSSRRGQYMLADIILPQSVAQEITYILEQDPTAMRIIVERIMKEKILKDPSDWERPQAHIRPPYEQWNSNGSMIYLQKEGMEPGFHKEAMHKVSK